MLNINNTTEGYLKNVEIKGNTIQDSLGVGNLADIKSVGDKVEGQDLYEIPLLCVGENLWNIDNVHYGEIDTSTGQLKGEVNGVIVPKNLIKTSSLKLCAKAKDKEGLNIGFSFFCYDSKKQFIGIVSNGKYEPVTLVDGTVYIRVRMTKLNFAKIDKTSLEVEISENTSSLYRKYEENKLTILSPVQLEKVGDVADRIVETDGVWGVEKNIGTMVFDGSGTWYNASHQYPMEDYMYFNNTILAGIIIDTSTNNFNLICDRFNIYRVFDTAIFEEGVIVSGSETVWVKIEKNKLNSFNSDGFKTWLKSNNFSLKYQLATPTFTPLPHDQQIKLKTFANKTNISFLCDVEGTIKADVPKSLGATVNSHTTQIDSLNQELERVKKLEESTVSTVVTDKDFTVVEQTNQGYFEDVELKGRTDVNLIPNSKLIESKSGVSAKVKFTRVLQKDKKYTFVYNISNSTNSTNGTIRLPGTTAYYFTSSNQDFTNLKGYFVKIVTPTQEYSELEVWNRNSSEQLILADVLILEGDHTQNPPQYFEGLASVGDGTDELVVSSVWGDGNLFDGELESGTIMASTGALVGDLTRVRSLNYIVSPKSINISHNDSSKRIGVAVWDKSFNYIGFESHIGNVKYFNDNMYYVKFTMYDESNINASAMASKGTTPKPYTPHKTDKKKLLCFDTVDNTWKKPVLREWDTVEKHSDGKYYYHVRSEEVVLDGSENWVLGTTNGTINNLRFNLITTNISSNSPLICDRLINQSGYSADVEGVSMGGNDGKTLSVYLFKSKLATQDVAGFKKWLQANNVKVVYQLKEEQVYECTNLDLITYPNETNYHVKSGVLSPRTTLKVHSNISNVVSLLQKKVSLLEGNMSKYMVTQNRLMLDSRYSADSVTFKVDYPSMANEKITELDYDLFNLLKANVLVGKDNYNYEKMINRIDFYQSIGMIDWDMWDEIWLIMKFQHNPPVEELPEETPEI